MSKIFSKTVKKTTLWSVIIAVVLAAAIVICALFGFNKDLALKDSKTMTVSLNAYIYNTQLDEVKDDLQDKLDADYVLEGSMSGDVSELLFVFDADADLTALKTEVETYLADKKANAEGWANAKYSVSVSSEKATAVLAKHYVLRAAIAGAILAVLAFVYVSIRYKLAGGLVAGVSVLLSMLLATALILLSRVYVTSTAAYAIAIAGLLAAAATLFTLNKIRDAQKEEGASLEETVASSVAAKETLYVAAVVAVGVILVAVLGGAAALWFAASALLAIVAAVLVSLVFAPAMYLSVQSTFANKPAKTGYKGAVKTSKKVKKAYAKETKAVEAPVEEVAEEVAEAPVEEVAEEVAEAPVEEVAEEVAEAPVEEAAEEVAEAPVEEAAEEVAEAPVEEAAEEVAEAPVEEAAEEVAEAPVEEAPVEEKTEE